MWTYVYSACVLSSPVPVALVSFFQTNPEEGGGINWDMEMDRLLVMQMVIKMADINTPTKNFDLHRNWSKRITEEFYQQVGMASDTYIRRVV